MQSEYSYQNGQSIYDISNLLYGSLDYLISFGRSVEYAYESGETLGYDDSVVSKIFTMSKKVNPKSSLRAVQGQSVYDVALMTVGLDKLVSLVNSSQVSSLNSGDISGNVFSFANIDSQDKLLGMTIDKFGYVFATYSKDGITERIARITEAFVIRITESGIIRIIE